jgi:hypothetical protein
MCIHAHSTGAIATAAVAVTANSVLHYSVGASRAAVCWDHGTGAGWELCCEVCRPVGWGVNSLCATVSRRAGLSCINKAASA